MLHVVVTALRLLKLSDFGAIAKLPPYFLVLASKCVQVCSDSETVMVLMAVSRLVALEKLE